MPAPAPSAASVGHDTLITVKVHYDGTTRRLKMPFKDMKAEVFSQKVKSLSFFPLHQSSDRGKLDYGRFPCLSESGTPSSYTFPRDHYDHTPGDPDHNTIRSLK